MGRRFFTALISSLLACAWFAPAQAQPRNPDTLVYAHLGEVTSLDPVAPYDAVSQGLIMNVYDTLVRFKGESLTEMEPVLAARVPTVKNGMISKDGLVYRFQIKKGIRFHDGSPLTPEDVRYSLLRFMLSDPAGGPASLLLEPVLGVSSTRNDKGEPALSDSDISSAVKVNGDTVVVTLKRPFAPFMTIMARWSYVMNAKWCAARGEWDGNVSSWRNFNNRPKDKSGLFEAMNGTGPFMLERWDRRMKRLHLVRFENYWGAVPALKRIMLVSMPEFGTRRLMLESGDADIIDVPRPFEPQLRGLKGVTLADNLPRLMTDPVFFFTFKINAAGNPDVGSGALDGAGITPEFFTDPDVRKGFAYAFNYNAFVTQSMGGKARRALGTIPPGLLGYNPSVESYSFDLKKAEEHFKKAWGGRVWEKGFRFTMTYNIGGDVRQLACEMMKKNVESLNPKFKIDLRGLEWPAYLEKAQARKMPLFTRGWTGDYPDPHNFIFPFYHSDGRYAQSQGYSNAKMDSLIEKAVRENTAARRVSLYGQIQKLAHEETVQVYSVHPQGLYAMRDWVKGFYDNAVFMGINFYPLKKQ